MDVFKKLLAIRAERLDEQRLTKQVKRALKVRFLAGLGLGVIIGMLTIAVLSIQTIEITHPAGVYKVASLDICGKFITLWRSGKEASGW